MSFATELNKVTRCPMSLTVIKMDACANTFGVAPCTATGVQCYNTYKTCVDRPNYVKTIKDYEYCNNDAPRNATFLELNAKPYEQNIEFMGTELREDKTIPARAAFTFMDEPDYDQGIDPYRSARTPNLLDVKGSYWKKWIERNPYYKGRILEHYKGFDGITKGEFIKDFSGKIENITRSGKSIKITCTDDIVDLSDKTYPFKTNIKIDQDLGACTEVKNQDEMLKLSAVAGDYAIRLDYAVMPLYVGTTYDVGSTLEGRFYYQVVAYNVNNDAIAQSELLLFDAGEIQNKISIGWDAVTSATYYRVFRFVGDYATVINYYQTTGLSILDYGQTLFTTPGLVPVNAYRLFQFSGGEPTDLTAWAELTSPLTLLLNSVSGIDTAGYLKVDDEVIYYNGITSLTLQNVKRNQYKTKGQRHYKGTNVKLVTYYTRQNGFVILEDLWLNAGIPASRIDDSTLDSLAAAWTGIDFSTKPILKDTNGGELTKDLCWVMDVKYWVNEDGKLTVRRNDGETVDHNITDAENIVLDSKSVDFNQDEIYTRVLLHTNRDDVSKSGTDKENYADSFLEVYADAEGPNMFNKEILLEVLTTWINDDCGTTDEIETYVADLLNKKIKRLITPRAKLSFDVELKDRSVKVGQVVRLTSNAFNDIDGNDYALKLAEVIKKEPAGARIKLTVRMLAVDEITTTSQHQIKIYTNPIPVRAFSLKEVKVTGLSVNGQTGTGAFSITDKASIEWDNMYLSEAETATDINGVTRSLPLIQAYAGIPPNMSPVGDPYVDTSGWKTVSKYNIYMFVGYQGATAPATQRPTSNDANGKWYLIGTVPDIRILDVSKKYKLEYALPVSPLGRYIAFDIYADANLVFDPNAPVGIDIGQLL